MTAALTAMLYVPGGAEDKLDNIARLDAKAYILDLEDAVAVSAKPTARILHQRPAHVPRSRRWSSPSS